MTATLEQTQSELQKFVGLVQQGEEVLITSEGRPVAKLTGLALPQANPDRHAWLARLARLRETTTTGKCGPTTEEILNDLRSERGE